MKKQIKKIKKKFDKTKIKYNKVIILDVKGKEKIKKNCV